MPKIIGNNRISALKRLGKPYPINDPNSRLLTGSKNASIKDARELLGNRNKTSFDARQLLSRQSSKIVTTVSKNIIVRNNLIQNNEDMVVVTGLKDMKMKDGRLIPTATIGGTQVEKKKQIFAVGPSTFVTIRNSNNNNTNISSNQSTEKISLTKTIVNPFVRRDDDDRSSQTTNTSSSSNQKVVISFVNDKYQKNPDPPQPTITKSSSPLIHRRNSPPVIKRLHDASIQTTPLSTSSRSPIRISSHRRQNSTITHEEDSSDERTIDDDLYEPAVKRTTSSTRKTTATNKEQQAASTATSTGSVKRTSTGAPVSSRMTSSVSTVSKQSSTTQSSSTTGTILVTNLRSSVSEEDVIELFGQIGRINEITTLSQGCIQIVYAKREHGEQAVTKYHNRLLDGQFMYVSLQQPSASSKPTSSIQQPSSSSKLTSSIQQPTKENGTSANSSSTANQPLKFNTSNNTLNKIAIDPAFIRQALFHPSNNTTNPVQFQVKL